jgi:hypothetical protein
MRILWGWRGRDWQELAAVLQVQEQKVLLICLPEETLKYSQEAMRACYNVGIAFPRVIQGGDMQEVAFAIVPRERCFVRDTRPCFHQSWRKLPSTDLFVEPRHQPMKRENVDGIILP